MTIKKAVAKKRMTSSKTAGERYAIFWNHDELGGRLFNTEAEALEAATKDLYPDDEDEIEIVRLVSCGKYQQTTALVKLS